MRALILFWLLFSCSAAFAEIYKYIDSKGSVHITNVPSSPQCKLYGCTLIVETPIDSKEAIVAPNSEEPVAPKESIAPAVTDKNLAQVNSNQKEKKIIPEEAVQNLVTKWLNSWKSGDMETYRSCYASDFKSKRMNLDTWVSHKTNIYKKSKNININIDKLQISAGENKATAVFTQSYSSSIFEYYSGTKKL
jgi:hypothetical protein